jgi:hypothetical protein
MPLDFSYYIFLIRKISPCKKDHLDENKSKFLKIKGTIIDLSVKIYD